MSDPLGNLGAHSDLKQQVSIRKKLREHIEARNDGFATAENPIIADKYAYKLNQLNNNIDLAQEGKLSYEHSDRALYATEPSQGYISQDSVVLDTSVLVKPSQIHPEREKYVKILKQLQRETSSVNRLGVPIPVAAA